MAARSNCEAGVVPCLLTNLNPQAGQWRDRSVSAPAQARMTPPSLLSSLTAADLFHLFLAATTTGHPMRLFRLPLVDKIDYICKRKFINSDSELEVIRVASLELGSFNGHIAAGNIRFMPILS